MVAAVALLVLTLRFTIGQARRSRATWLAGRAGSAEAEVGGDGDGDGDGDDAEEEPEEEGMTALVLAGGSTRGAIQIGMLQVLAEHGFVPGSRLRLLGRCHQRCRVRRQSDAPGSRADGPDLAGPPT